MDSSSLLLLARRRCIYLSVWSLRPTVPCFTAAAKGRRMSCRICRFRHGISRRRPPSLLSVSPPPPSDPIQNGMAACIRALKQVVTMYPFPSLIMHVFVECGGPLQGNPPLAGATATYPYPAKGDLPGDAPSHTVVLSTLPLRLKVGEDGARLPEPAGYIRPFFSSSDRSPISDPTWIWTKALKPTTGPSTA